MDAGGNPVKVDGPTIWACSDPTIVTCEVATGNPLIANFVAANPKLNEVGRIMFAFGLLAFLLAVGEGRLVSIVPK